MTDKQFATLLSYLNVRKSFSKRGRRWDNYWNFQWLMHIVEDVRRKHG